jgi:hypothetical protein
MLNTNALYAQGRARKAAAQTQASKLQHTPLIQAVIAGNFDQVNALLALGADPNARTIGQLTALHFAVLRYSQLIAGYRGLTQIQRSEQVVNALLTAGADINAWDESHRLPSAYAENGRIPPKLKAAVEACALEVQVGDWLSDGRGNKHWAADYVTEFNAYYNLHDDQEAGSTGRRGNTNGRGAKRKAAVECEAA